MTQGAQDNGLLMTSLELVAERCDDLVPLVYARLFAARPDLREFFAIGSADNPRTGMGNMVNEILRILADEGTLDLHNEAQAAVVFHTGWGLGMDMYRDVVGAVVDTVGEICGQDWPAYAGAWQDRVRTVSQALQASYDEIEGHR